MIRLVRARLPLVIGAVLPFAACDGEPAGLDALAPEVVASSVAPNDHNVLSAIVSVRARRADSLMVRYGPTGGPLDDATPATVPEAEDVVLPVLGLHPETEYILQVVAFGSRVETGEVLSFTTGSLPDDLPAYLAGGPAPSLGHVVFAAGPFGLVLDNAGRVVWYRRFPDGPGLNFQAQPNGRYVARPPPTDPAAVGPWVEIDPLGNITRTLGCVGELPSRFHDLIAQPDGSYWILCDETRILDLSHLGGSVDASVIGTTVQHVGEDGTLLFAWSPFDHFEVEHLDPDQVAAPAVNWTHGNALDLDGDGNLLVSFRNLSEITKIDTVTGEVVWRMGGAGNEFAFQEARAGFARQHGLRVTGPDRFLLLDNLGDPLESRVERYVYDPVERTARLEASYGSAPAVVASLGGTTQPLPDGRMLVSFGNGGRVEEYDADGAVVWRIESPGYVFRAQRIRSLYSPGTGSPR